MRRRPPPGALAPWPSFVDALSAALLVLVFIITLLSIRSGQVLEGIEAEAAAEEAEASIVQTIAQEIQQDGVKVVRDGERLRILLPDTLLFASGEADLSPEGQRLILSLAPRLGALGGDIEVQGHTDDRPITGALMARYPTNWELSTARATAVVRLLEEEAGLDPGRLSGVGYGQHRPIVPNVSEADRARNRRIELVATGEGGDGR